METTLAVFTLQFCFNVVVYTMIIVWFVIPRLRHESVHNALTPLLFPHAMRCLGLTYLVPIVTDASIPIVFSRTTASGDFVAAGLALVSILGLRYLPKTGRHDLSIPMVWISNSAGLVDLVITFTLAFKVEILNYQLSSLWFVPSFVVPGLIVTHLTIFWILWKHYQGKWR